MKWTTEVPSREGWCVWRYLNNKNMPYFGFIEKRLRGLYINTVGEWYQLSKFLSKNKNVEWFTIPD